MTQTVTNPDNRTQTYAAGATFIQWTDGADAIKVAIVPAWVFTPNMTEWDIDRIDTAAPIYTKKSDILGTFTFTLKNQLEFYDTALPSADPLTPSTWITNIAEGKPPVVTFAPVLNAPDASTNPYINLIFDGRVTEVPINQVLDVGVTDIQISGEITKITQIRREATANNEG